MPTRNIRSTRRTRAVPTGCARRAMAVALLSVTGAATTYFGVLGLTNAQPESVAVRRGGAARAARVGGRPSLVDFGR